MDGPNRDTFQTSQPPAAAPPRGRGTQPLARAATSPLVAAEWQQGGWGQLIAKSREHFERLRPAMTTLYQACRATGLPMPGITGAAYRLEGQFDPPAALATTLRGDRTLLQRALVGLFRYQEAHETLETVPDDEPEGVAAEAIRRKLYYLSRLEPELSAEARLKELFGAKAVAAPSAPQTMAERLEAKTRRQGIVIQGEILAEQLAPRFDVLKRAVDFTNPAKGLQLGAMLGNETRHARMLGFSLSAQAGLKALAEEAIASFEGLRKALEAARGSEEVAGLEAALATFKPLAARLYEQAAMRDVFPPSERASLPLADSNPE